MDGEEPVTEGESTESEGVDSAAEESAEPAQAESEVTREEEPAEPAPAKRRRNITISLDKSSLARNLLTIAGLIFIIYIAVYVRWGTMSSPTVLDYDPFWHYRHAKEIIDNGFQKPSWDILSFYPPGRPVEYFQGWEFAMAFFYELIKLFANVDFIYVAKISPVIMVGLTAIPAFLLGKLIANKWAGLATALFATLSPTFIGVSMAGYCDTDATVIFYFFLAMYAITLALTKRKWYHIIFAILSNALFIWTWGAGWFPLVIFTVFLPGYIIFKMIEDLIGNRTLKINIGRTFKELKPMLLPFIIILVVTSIFGYIFNLGNIFKSFVGGLSFVGISGEPALVNISVAELQVLNIFSQNGFMTVVGRVGLAPTILTLIGLPLLVIFKLIKRIKMSFVEILLFTWAIVTFYLILHGVRFSILFSAAAATAAGYVIGNVFIYLKNRALRLSAFGAIAILCVIFISNGMQTGYGAAGMSISGNWIQMLDWIDENADEDALLVTWWDPGHILAGYTGRKVHADGAHCGPAQCVIDHNTRIQDMGRMFTTSDEDETVQILQKYKQLTPEQCAEVREKFGDDVPEDACDPVTEFYFIASNDLIAKYYWMSYFGDCLSQEGLANADSCYSASPNWFKENAAGRNFFQFSFTNFDQTQGVAVYNNGQLSLVRTEDKWVPVLNMPESGVRNVMVRTIVYYENNALISHTFNETNAIEGTLWVDPQFSSAIFMDGTIENSVFTRMFFYNGEGLDNFELVLSNPEIRLYKLKDEVAAQL